MQSYSLTQWVLFFFIYSFFGWIWESCYVSLKKRHWVNRGFMHGPMLPIYGSGAVVVLVAVIGVRDNDVLIFLLGMTAATVLEYVTGAVMERLFHVKYWDYSNQKLNVNGYICVSSSLCWGVFSVLLIKVIHVPIEQFVLKLPMLVSDVTAFALSVAAAVDLTQSFNEAMDLKRILAQLDESRQQIQKMQDKLKIVSDEAIADYRKRSEERAQRKLSRKEAYLERINMRRDERRRQLEALTAKAEQLLREELPSRVGGLLGNTQKEELLAMKENITKEFQKMGDRSDRVYLHAAKHLRRNPTAVSERFRTALEELKKTVEDK